MRILTATTEMGFSLENIKSRVFIMKVLQLVRTRASECLINEATGQVLILIVFLIFRLGRSGDVFQWGYHAGCPLSERAENEMVLGVTTSAGYLYIVLILLVGVAMGDTGKYTVIKHTTKLSTG